MITDATCSIFEALLSKYILQAFLIVLGWWIVHLLSAKRDAKKVKIDNLLKVIDDVLTLLDELLNSGIKYHTDKREPHLEFVIKNGLKNYSILIHALLKIMPTSVECSQCVGGVMKIRKALTSSHFEDEHLEAIDLNNIVLANLADVYSQAKQDLIKLKFSLLVYDN